MTSRSRVRPARVPGDVRFLVDHHARRPKSPPRRRRPPRLGADDAAEISEEEPAYWARIGRRRAYGETAPAAPRGGHRPSSARSSGWPGPARCRAAGGARGDGWPAAATTGLRLRAGATQAGLPAAAPAAEPACRRARPSPTPRPRRARATSRSPRGLAMTDDVIGYAWPKRQPDGLSLPLAARGAATRRCRSGPPTRSRRCWGRRRAARARGDAAALAAKRRGCSAPAARPTAGRGRPPARSSPPPRPRDLRRPAAVTDVDGSRYEFVPRRDQREPPGRVGRQAAFAEAARDAEWRRSLTARSWSGVRGRCAGAAGLPWHNPPYSRSGHAPPRRAGPRRLRGPASTASAGACPWRRR